MPALDHLACRLGQRGGAANRDLARLCAADPTLLAELRPHLQARDKAVQGDTAEVFCETAKLDPSAVAPYAAELLALLGHRNNRAQWEALGAVALVTALVPHAVVPKAAGLLQAARTGSVIVADRAVQILGTLGAVKPEQVPGLTLELVAFLATVAPRELAKHAEHVVEAARRDPAAAEALRKVLAIGLATAEGATVGRLRRVLRRC